MASTIAAVVNVAILAVLLHRRGIFQPDPRLKSRSVRIIGASLMMALWVAAAQKFAAPDLPNWHGIWRLSMLGALIVFGGVVYAISLDALKVLKLSDVLAALQTRIARRRTR